MLTTSVLWPSFYILLKNASYALAHHYGNSLERIVFMWEVWEEIFKVLLGCRELGQNADWESKVKLQTFWLLLVLYFVIHVNMHVCFRLYIVVAPVWWSVIAMLTHFYNIHSAKLARQSPSPNLTNEFWPPTDRTANTGNNRVSCPGLREGTRTFK